MSLGFTFVGAAVFATVRTHRSRIPQEAIIGICYPVASAASILAMSKAPSESEHLKDMVVGNILAVSWPEVFKTAVLYGAVGAFHSFDVTSGSRNAAGSDACRFGDRLQNRFSETRGRRPRRYRRAAGSYRDFDDGFR